MALVDRVAAEASKLRPLQAVLTVLTVPFYLLGWLLGLLFVAIMFAFGAIRVGFNEARSRTGQRPAPADPLAAPGDDAEVA